jgi:hypothetical protein
MKRSTEYRIKTGAVFLLIALYFLFYFIEQDESYEISMKTRTIERDGFLVFYNPEFKNFSGLDETLMKMALEKLPPGYEFLNYIYAIENTALSTFHRDVTSSANIYKTTYPVYTLILYKYDGCLLSLCPGSHASYPFVNSHILNIHGKAGTCFIFNCDVLHAGCSNECKPRSIIQYKICHQDDVHLLNHLNNISIEKEEPCSDTFYNRFLRKLSYMFEFPVNYLFYPLLIKKHNDGLIGQIQDNISIQFYNNT